MKDWDINIYRGVLTGFNEAFIIDEETKNKLIEEDNKSQELIKPLVRGRDIKRYSYNFANLYLITTFPALKINIDNYPAIKKHLDKYYKQLEKRQDKGITPYNLRNCAYLEEFEKDKIAWQRVKDKNKFALSEKGQYILDSMAFIISFKNKETYLYLLAILNSNLVYYWIKHNVHEYGSTGFRLSNQYVELIPIPETDEKTRDKMIKFVEHIINLKEKINTIKNPNEVKNTQRQIDAIEKNIDEIVYKLYNLNDSEIKIIEEA